MKTSHFEERIALHAVQTAQIAFDFTILTVRAYTRTASMSVEPGGSSFIAARQTETNSVAEMRLSVS